MRNRWIAPGLIVVIVGIAVAYRLARRDHPQDASPARGAGAETADAEAPPVEPPAPRPDAADAPGAERPAASVKRETPADGGGVAGRRSTETRGWTPSAPQVAVPQPDVAPRNESGGAASAPHQSGGSAPAVAAAPVGPSGYPATAPAVPARDPSKTDAATAPADDPESDRHPPILQALRFDPPQIQDGGVAVLSVGATDDLSGVKSVVGTIRSPSAAAFVPFVAQDAGGTGEFTARITIPSQAETGDWFVGSLQIVDRANNPVSLAFARATVPAGGALRVVSADSDSTAPTVRRVFVEKGTVGGGEKNQIVIDVEDDRSGVASVTGSFQSPSRSAFIPFSAVPSSEGSWSGMVAVPAAADCGEWTLRQIRVADKANNSAILMADSPELGRVSFVVAGGGACDSDPPVLETLFVSPLVVSNTAPAEVTLTATARDDGSGLVSLTGRIEGPVSASGQVPKIFFATRPDPKNPDAPMIARIAVPQYAANGIWRVVVLELTDKARNAHAYNAADPALANAYFTVE